MTAEQQAAAGDTFPGRPASCRYSWCSEHEQAGDNGKPTHTSRAVSVTVADGTQPVRLLNAELFHDEVYATPELWVQGERCDELALDRKQAEQLLQDTEAFLDQLRRLVRHLTPKAAA